MQRHQDYLLFVYRQFLIIKLQVKHRSMSHSSLKAKILNFFNPSPILPISNPNIPRSNTTSHLTHFKDLTQSRSSINRDSYLNLEETITQHLSSKITSQRSNSNKKKKLNVVSNPHRLNLTSQQDNNNGRGQIQQFKELAISRKKQSRIRLNNSMDLNDKQGIKKSQSLKSFNTVQIKIEGNNHRQNRPTLILKERIVPVRINTINSPYQVCSPRLAITQSQQPQTPICRLNMTNEAANRKSPFVFHPPVTLGHNLPAETVIRVIQKREIPLNFVASQPFSQSLQKKNKACKDTRSINGSPGGFIRHQKRSQSPLTHTQQRPKQMVLSPSLAATPLNESKQSSILPVRRSSSSSCLMERSLQIKCGVLNDDKRMHNNLKGKIIPNTLKMNAHQQALTLLSQNTLPIQRKQQFLRIDRDSNRRKLITSNPQNQPKSTAYIGYSHPSSQMPLSVPTATNTNNTIQNKSRHQSQHKLQLSPNPVKHPTKQHQNSLTHQSNLKVLEDQPKINPLLLESNSKGLEKISNSNQKIEQQRSTRQNHFARQLSQEIIRIQHQREEKQNSIAQKLDELSKRANSIVRMHSQQSRQSPQPPTKEQPLTICSINQPKESLVIYAAQSQHTLKTYPMSSESMALSFACRDKQNLHPPSNPTRTQILNKILS